MSSGITKNSSLNSFDARDTLTVGENDYEIYRLDAVPGTEKLPYSLKVLAENLLRTEDGANITKDHIESIAKWDPSADPSVEIQFTPARVIMQDGSASATQVRKSQHDLLQALCA